MYSNTEFRDKIKKVRPDYVLLSAKGNDKWKEARSFSSVIYPESIEGDVLSDCEKLGVPCALSPLHDRDLDEQDQVKKAHYHIVVKYNSKKNPYQFYCDLVGAFGENAFSTLEIVSDIGAMTRYLVHLDSDDPKKFKYDLESISCFNGFECKKYLFENTGDTMSNCEKIMDLIDSKNFIFFRELAIYLRQEDPLLWASLVKDREVKNFVMNYIKSTEHMYTYSGIVEKGYTKVRMENGVEKVIFNRELKFDSV